MKKTLFLCTLVALSSAALAADNTASATTNAFHSSDYTYEGNTFTLTDVSTFAQTGTFAVSLHLSSPLYSSTTDILLSMSEGSGGISSQVSCSYSDTTMGGVCTISGNGKNEFVMGIPSITANVVLLQIENLFDASATATFYYLSDSGTLESIVTTAISASKHGERPDSLNFASLRVSSDLSGSTPLSGTTIATWQGVVSEDALDYYVKNGNSSTYEPTTGNSSDLSDILESDSYMEGVTGSITVEGDQVNIDATMPEGLVIKTPESNTQTNLEVNIGSNKTIGKDNLKANETNKIKLSGEGTYKLNDEELSLGTGITLDESEWKGTVQTGNLDSTTTADINSLGTSDSTVELKSSSTEEVSLGSLTADEVGTVTVEGNKALVLESGDSETRNLTVQGGLELGSDTTKATLSVGGKLSLGSQGITLNSTGSMVTANEVEYTTSTLSITLTDNYIKELAGGTAEVLTLGNTTNVDITLNNLALNDTGDSAEMQSVDGKYFYTINWETPVSLFSFRAPRATPPSKVTITGTPNPTYVQEKLAGTVHSHNGCAGLDIMNKAFAGLDPQNNAPGGALAGLMDLVDAGATTDKDMAAAAGASTAVLGQALSGDTDRQLRAIRNRAVSGSKGSDTITVTLTDEKGTGIRSTSPATFNVWVNAEGNRAEQDADGTAAGYTLSSWGATVGAGIKMNKQLTLGLALTAMRGDLDSDGPDYLKGDMDTTYLSAFASYQRGAWSHNFIGTAGTMEADYKRTVSHAKGSYSTNGDTDGTAFGLMYELSRQFELTSRSSISPLFNIAYRHTKVDGYNERNTDAALSVGDQSLDTVTVGMGARYDAVVGEQAINRSCAFEARALIKCDLGDRRSDTMVGFAGQAARSNIESAKMGAVGLELGTGISVPVGSGSIFADGAVELRADYTNFNATVGYRILF